MNGCITSVYVYVYMYMCLCAASAGVSRSLRYKGVVDAFRSVLKNEGPRSLYRGTHTHTHIYIYIYIYIYAHMHAFSEIAS